MPMYLFGTKENLRSKNRPCIIHPKENFGEPFIPQFSLPVILFAKYFGGLFCVVDLQKENSSDCPGEPSKGVEGESGSSASSSSVSLSSSSHNSQSNGSAGGSDAKVALDTGGRNGPVPTRSAPLTPLQSRLQAVEDLKCAADYLLGAGAGAGVCGRGDEKGNGSGDANGVGEGGGGGGGGGDVHAMHGKWRD
jgi:hypothetical protein